MMIMRRTLGAGVDNDDNEEDPICRCWTHDNHNHVNEEDPYIYTGAGVDNEDDNDVNEEDPIYTYA